MRTLILGLTRVSLGSKLEVKIGPITVRKRRRTIEHGMQEVEDLESGKTVFEWMNQVYFVNGSHTSHGSHTSLCCPSHRLFHNLRARYTTGDLYCVNFIKTEQWYKLPALGGLRARKLLNMKAANGDLAHIRDHLHWSLLTTKPIFWDVLMRLINQTCPEMYTPADKPLISSYKFGMPRNPDDDQLKKLFPCLSGFIGKVDNTQNYWQAKCPLCRNGCKFDERGYTTKFAEHIVWLQQTVFPKLHARDVAMKWAYVGRRLVYKI